MYNQIYDYWNLLESWKKTQKLKRYREDVILFRKNLDENLITLQCELYWKTYKVSFYRSHYIFEPKKRLIRVLPLRDRVAQHALVAIIEPGIDKHFIYDSHACRKGHGVKLAIDRFIKMAKPNKYCLKCDISSYFHSINHDILMDLYRKKIKCPDVLNLIETIIRSVENPGLPIGNLLSQLSANLYLHELDRFMKHVLKCSKYIRYMDDFVLFSNDKNHLHNVRNEIKEFLFKNLALTLSNKKSTLHETRNGVVFCGYKCHPSHCVVKSSTRKRNRKRMVNLAFGLQNGTINPKEFADSIVSIIGHSEYSRNYSYRKNICDSIAFNIR